MSPLGKEIDPRVEILQHTSRESDEYQLAASGIYTDYLYVVQGVARKFAPPLPEGDVDEIVQDAFGKAFRSIEGYQEQSTFKGWLHVITKRVGIDKVRSKKSLLVAETSLDRLVEPDTLLPTKIRKRIEASASETVEDDVVSEAGFEELLSFVAMLNPTQKEALLLSLQGYSYDEIAEIQNVPRATVGTRIYRAKERLGQNPELRLITGLGDDSVRKSA